MRPVHSTASCNGHAQQGRDMTCEDNDEGTNESLAEKGVRQIAAVLASSSVRTLAKRLPQSMRRAMAILLLTAADVFRA